MRFEQDEVTLLGGVRHGRTLGSPIAISRWQPSEWVKSDKCTKRCLPAPGRTNDPLHPTSTRHADLAGMQKVRVR